ncbi:STAS domain-containing protein [Allochromatium palmeri]|uniref:STAS domain-containing protein n=1 Tax=Allochromatium palmeri TaxID=231048 RepID=A0A6N8EBJ9_9GAMM|nr:STAS domain-containing protein [Allochromatium palmeri]MTW20961.1 STAS domain-containing protein [Allochromatium palmeri]
MNAQPECPTDTDPLVLDGELTIYTAAETAARLRAHLAERRVCALDLSGISELDGAGLQLLLWLHETLRARGGTLRLVAYSPVVAEVLSLLHLTAQFDLDSAGATVGGAS